MIADVEPLLATNALRERLWMQLITALYRAGRQADALDAYQRVRDLLATELSIEPSRDLQRVQAQVLSQWRHLQRRRTPRSTSTNCSRSQLPSSRVR